jgi:protein-S-isoprenylcysteine O-methyltransferase Ste14
MDDGPSTLAMYSVWVYWLGVLVMTVKVRLQGATSAVMIPRQPLERLMWIVWVPVIATWIVSPWASIHRSTSPSWRLPDAAMVEPSWYALRWVAAGLTVACLVGTIFCWRWMGRNWRVAVDADQASELIVTGPFSRVRHPIYTLSMVMIIATLAAVPIWPLLAASLLHITLMHLKALNEERAMLLVHGDAYAGYRERTGRFLPRI